MSRPPSPEFVAALAEEPPGRALDLACGDGRHARWLAERGWKVTATDLIPTVIEGVEFTVTDLERKGHMIEPGKWDLIVCWLYWQPELLPPIAAGIRPGGIVALAGKTTGRFATSLTNYRKAFPNWTELHVAENETQTRFIARRCSWPCGVS